MIFAASVMDRSEKCPLGCGRNWHGLPKEAYGKAKFCPSPFGVPVPVFQPAHEQANHEQEDVA